jgi:GNAT superfamily N-acetyltransferase
MYINFLELDQLLMADPAITYPIRRELQKGFAQNAGLWFTCDAMLLHSHWLFMYGNSSGLDELLPQLQPREYRFFGLQQSYLPLLKEHFVDVQMEEDCGAYTLSQEDFTLEPVTDPGILTLADAELVDSHWSYRFPGSLDYIRHIIVNCPSSAVRVDEQLVGWALCYDATDDMVNLGALKVLEEYRRAGFGKILALSLAQKVLASGKTPLVHISQANHISQQLTTGMGFRRHPQPIFWGKGLKI